MQPSIEKFYYQDVTIWRQKPTQDKFGGVSTTPEKVEIQAKMRLWGASGRLTKEVEGKVYLPTHRAACGPDVDVQAGDRIQTPDQSFIVLSKILRRQEAVIHHVSLELAQEAR